MRRSASEIIRNLESRIARLERTATRVNWNDLLDQANDVSIRLHFDLMVALEDLAGGEGIGNDEVRYAIHRAEAHLKNTQASRSDKNKLQNILDALQSI